MKIVVIGGGPGGLYFALLARRADPSRDVTVIERNAPGDAFGWGVVFSDQTLATFAQADEASCAAITARFARWDDIDVHIGDRVITSSGHGFAGIARTALLGILQDRARELGVELRFGTEVTDDGDLEHLGLAGADLVVAADGVHSAVRARHKGVFRPELDRRPARFVWLGTTRPFDAFTFLFVRNRHGIFQAHAYRFDREHATFIVECDERSWRNAGFDRLDIEGTIRASEELFAPWLEGHRLLANTPPRQRAAPWQQFVLVRNERWFDGSTVLLGDAAHTAHFTIGSGTKLAMEDAIALARLLPPGRPVASDLAAALSAYQEERMTEALRLQNAARNSMEWFEHVERHIGLAPEQFAYSLLTRSQRISHENLRLRDRRYLEGVERWFAGRADPEQPASAVPPMFTPFRLRGLTLPNRIVVSPMDMYCAVDGTPNDFHLVHLGARALGGAALVMTEMTCVSPEGRITPGCTGMYRPEHRDAWSRIVEMVHRWTPAAICLQLGHSGRKGSTRLMWEGMDEPLVEGNWPVMAPSPVPWSPRNQVPREMTGADLDRVREEFVRAARFGLEAGFDMLELHCAHGYLLSSFITPVSNRRSDAWGGSLKNRLRYPLKVFRAVRAVWPDDRPVSVRISAHDWVEDGVTGAEAVEIARAFHAAGADIIHVSSGQTSTSARPVYGRMYQTPLSDQIRNEGGVPTIAVGNITDYDQVNGIIAAGRADLCALGRPHLSDPQWTLRAAAAQGFADQPWPVQYVQGRTQLERLFSRRTP